MFGPFQQSNLRLEVEASEATIRDSLTRPDQFQQWMSPQRFSAGLPDALQAGLAFSSWVGPIEIVHQVDVVNTNTLRFLLSRGIDGFHQWSWGDGWVQSSLEGISLLPLNLGQTVALTRLRQFLVNQ
ncbi:MAG TPA: hypothetical protein V6C78_14825 [Crinalium sp.]|jgi:hypothetical protein